MDNPIVSYLYTKTLKSLLHENIDFKNKIWLAYILQLKVKENPKLLQ